MSATDEVIPVLLTVPEVAKVLCTSPKAIYAMAGRGQLPGLTRLGRRILVRRQALVDFLDHNCASSSRSRRR